MAGDLKINSINVANIYDASGRDQGTWEFLGYDEVAVGGAYIDSEGWISRKKWWPKYQTLKIVGEKFQVQTDNQEFLMQYYDATTPGIRNTSANTYLGKYDIYITTAANGVDVTGNRKWSNGTFSFITNVGNDAEYRANFVMTIPQFGHSAYYKHFEATVVSGDIGGTAGLKYMRNFMGCQMTNPIDGIRMWPRTQSTTTNTNFDEGRLLIYGIRNPDWND